MSDENLKQDRRSTRVSITIPVIISGVDADGHEYSECVRTVIVNKHGGKIATTRHLALGADVLIENRAVGVVAKASVAWLSEKHLAGDLHHMGLQLLEAQNIWGIAFPPDDWVAERGEEDLEGPRAPSTSGHEDSEGEGTHVSSLAGDEISIRVLHELQEAADTYAQDFQDRLKQLTQRLGWELESELRDRTSAKVHELEAMEEQIRTLRESLNSARKELGKLEARVQELKSDHHGAPEDSSPHLVKEAQRQLAALSNSIVEGMKRAAEEGLRDYRTLLQKENQESAARLRADLAGNPPAPAGAPPKH